MGQVHISRIMMQNCPRADSITALYLLTQTEAGERKYPGVSTAKLGFWDTGTMSPDDKTWEQRLKEGTILIGVGGGPFDEHPNHQFGDGKASSLSSTLLVARDLGLDHDPIYERLVATTTKNDLEVAKSEYDLSVLIKLLHRSGMNPVDVIKWVFKALDSIVQKQIRFLEARADFDRNKDFKTFKGPDNKKYVVVYIESDSEEMWSAVRCRFQNIAVLIQQRKSGRVQIFGNEKFGVDLGKVVKEIRSSELLARGLCEESNDLHQGVEDILSLPGQIAEVPNWCYQPEGQLLLNGSETAPALAPTMIEIMLIKKIILENIRFKVLATADMAVAAA